MTKISVTAPNAPKAVGPYSPAVWAGDTLYISGQIGIDPTTSQLVSDDAAAQADQTLKNLGALIEAAELTFDHVVKTTVILSDLADYPAVNEVYAKYFDAPAPARAAFAVKSLPLGAKVEIDAVAHKHL